MECPLSAVERNALARLPVRHSNRAWQRRQSLGTERTRWPVARAKASSLFPSSLAREYSRPQPTGRGEPNGRRGYRAFSIRLTLQGHLKMHLGNRLLHERALHGANAKSKAIPRAKIADSRRSTQRGHAFIRPRRPVICQGTRKFCPPISPKFTIRCAPAHHSVDGTTPCDPPSGELHLRRNKAPSRLRIRAPLHARSNIGERNASSFTRAVRARGLRNSYLRCVVERPASRSQSSRRSSHLGALWREEFPPMMAWAVGR